MYVCRNMYVYVCVYYVLFMYVCMYICMYTFLFLTSAPIADSLRTKPTVYRHDINLPDCNRRLFN
jgi:hypothetical protein